ncbi:hypothetical protein DFH07DRAFT_764716 [Mycena maculata]|uniref:Uncharacterized protein n=1 Tax=Mycena maculata TaxID=230809 RepID=A0AAD7NZV0_9AGAR|nr:hypothetical protein DFH07DRAFT_764716 [Mycena maculata]
MDVSGSTSTVNKFHNKSTLKCPDCLQDIKVGTGGQANLRSHIGTPKCLKSQKEHKKAKPKYALLTDYLKPKAAPVPSTVAAPEPVMGLTFSRVEPPEGTGPEPLEEPCAALDDLSDLFGQTPVPVICAHAQDLLRQLRSRFDNIPAFAPLVDSTHPLADFAVDPFLEFPQQRTSLDNWDEILLPMLHKAFGWGELDPKLSLAYISLGKYGLTSFCAFFEFFVVERQLKGYQIMPYFDFLLRGVEYRFPSSNDSIAPRDEAKRVQDEHHRALPTAGQDYPAESNKVKPCTGIELAFPPGGSHHVDYPFGLHQQYNLPWDYYSRHNQFFIQSKNCQRDLVVKGEPCKSCNSLLANDVLLGIIRRIWHGIHENTPLIYMPISGLIDCARRKTVQTRGLKLTKLNVVRQLLGKMAALDEHKQFVMAVASGKVERVAQLVQACLNNGVGIRGLLERYQRACEVVYNPKGFTEDDMLLGLLILRLGGARLAGIIHRAKGLPGISTLRKNRVILPLRASAGMPTVAEVEENIEAFTEGEPQSTGPPLIVHRVLMMDEIAVEQRPRWDDKTNKILGACRECSWKVALDFNTVEDLEVFCNAVENGDIHLASEATVAAFGVLSKDPRVYSPRPCCISGTDKHETGPEQAKFIQQILTAAKNKETRGNITYRTVSIASDGEAKRGSALVKLTMNRDLDPSSPIYPALSNLELMNLRVGEDDVTADKDYRHVLKTLRNLLMRLKGCMVLGFKITAPIIKQHLVAAGHSQEQVDAFLNVNDKQDVYLAFQLIKALWSLEDLPAGSSPGFIRTRKALQMFGHLGYHLLMPYIFIELSLHDQLVHLSTAAHLLFILYSDGKAGTAFMANQTYTNLMIMIKNQRSTFLILLGTDRLEVLFGLIRTAIGTDVNVDIYQLSTRASNLTETSIILASCPHWDRSPRRLKLPMIINEAGDISPNADHITPASWKGDVHVACSTLGVDIFSPLGSYLLDFIDEEPPEDFAIEPSLLPVVAPSTDPAAEPVPALLNPASSESPSGDCSYTPDGDVEDALAIAEPQGRFSPHMEINGKFISKAKALSAMMRYKGIRSSTDRLKRVAGLPSLSPTMEGAGIVSDSGLGAPSLRIGNPVAIVVSCEEQLFLAVAQVNDIKLASAAVASIALDMLLNSSAKISVQILRLVPATVTDDPTKKNDWCWSLSLEAACSNLPGNLIHPLNPVVSVVETGKPTYLFDSHSLLTSAATIHGQMLPADFFLVPKVKRTSAFPYRRGGLRSVPSSVPTVFPVLQTPAWGWRGSAS